MNYRCAGPRLRLAAFAIDYVVISLYLVLLVVTSVLLLVGPLKGSDLSFVAAPLARNVVVFLTTVLPVALYFALSEASPSHATLGKRKMGLQVANAEGSRLSLVRSLVRSFVKFLPWQLAHSLLLQIEGWPFALQEPSPLVSAGFVLVWVLIILYLAPMFLSRRHQTLYDRLAGSLVMVSPKRIVEVARPQRTT